MSIVVGIPACAKIANERIVHSTPARYADAHGSKLRVQVTEGTNELQPFRLTR